MTCRFYLAKAGGDHAVSISLISHHQQQIAAKRRHLRHGAPKARGAAEPPKAARRDAPPHGRNEPGPSPAGRGPHARRRGAGEGGPAESPERSLPEGGGAGARTRPQAGTPGGSARRSEAQGPRAERPRQRARDEASGAAKRQPKPKRPGAQPAEGGRGQAGREGADKGPKYRLSPPLAAGNRGRVRAEGQSPESPRGPDPGPLGCGPAGPRTPAKPGSWAKPSRAAKRPRPPDFSGGRSGGVLRHPPMGALCFVPRENL